MSAHQSLEVGNRMYINGEFVVGKHDNAIDVLDKYHLNTLETIPLATDDQIENAVNSADKAFAPLKKLTISQRSDALFQLAQIMQDRKEQLVAIIIAEAGKPRDYAATEIDRCITTVKAAAAQALSFGGEYVPVDMGAGQGKTAYTIRKPKGPVLAISPFNFPLNLALHKVAPAIAVGCPVILKPSSKTPLSAIILGEMFNELDLPKGSLNVVICTNDQAEIIVKDERIRFVSFTGGDGVGWHLKSLVNKKSVALELGGNGAALVSSSANITSAAKGLAKGAFLYAGQICISTQRIYVVEAQYDEFIAAFKSATESLGIGDPNNSGIQVGPLISSDAYDRVAQLVSEAKEHGAKILYEGVGDSKKNIYPPTILTNVKSSLAIVQDEAFAPIVVIESVDTFAQGIQAINDSKYGLQAGVYTFDTRELKQAHEQLDMGGVIINSPPGFRVDVMPYGGVKDSGHGREGPKYAMQEMTEPCLLVF